MGSVLQRYVADLKSMPARPGPFPKALQRACCIVHGRLDNDNGGGQLSRIQEWTSAFLPLATVVFPHTTNHSMMPWLTQQQESVEVAWTLSQCMQLVIERANPGYDSHVNQEDEVA